MLQHQAAQSKRAPSVGAARMPIIMHALTEKGSTDKTLGGGSEPVVSEAFQALLRVGNLTEIK